MLKQANFAVYIILFGSLLTISFLFVQNISKVKQNKKKLKNFKTFRFGMIIIFMKQNVEFIMLELKQKHQKNVLKKQNLHTVFI